MNLIAQWLDVWCAAMWRASWQGGLAVLIAWSICWLVPSIPARFQAWLWRLALLKFLVALAWAVPIELPLLPAAERSGWESSATVFALPPGMEVAPQELKKISTQEIFLQLVFLVWSAVLGGQAIRLGLEFRSASRYRNACRPSINPLLHDQLARLSREVGLRAPPALLERQGYGSPLLVGICRPAMVLPSDSLGLLDESERSLVLGHELAHLLRGDLFWGLIAAVVRMLFCFHPLAWLGERQTRLTQEIAADELAIALQKQEPVQYATLLVSVVSKISSSPLLPALSVGVAGSHFSLKRRLSAMRFAKPISRKNVLVYSLLLAIVAMIGLVPWAVVTAATPDKPAPKEASVGGKLTSYKEGLLKFQSDDGKEHEWKVAEDTKTIMTLKGVETITLAGEAFKHVERGIPITVHTKDDQLAWIQLGAKPADKPADKQAQKQKTYWGRFVSFRDGTLTIQVNSGDLIATRIPENAKTMVWDHARGAYQPGVTADVLANSEPGSTTAFIVRVSPENVSIHVGSRKSAAVGTFVSYKNDRLMMLGKNLGESFVKKYGNSLHFNRFRDDVPAYESVDGGEYKLIGTANQVLANVKEGAVLTIHGEGDDNITLVQIGVPKKD